MNSRMNIARSRNVPMMSTMVCYIHNAPEIEFLSPETNHEHIILVFMRGAYLVITFGYLLCVNEVTWVNYDRLCEHIEVGEKYSHSPHLMLPFLEGF